ncbi:MAG: UDP-glucose-hexose-phosphate uridylyltransferase [Chloroflexi bacterium]|nr:UDP-glucose-hexose-phosphate uridylyltransferase [Chloroflexota bacterium]
MVDAASQNSDLFKHPHRRYNPLSGEWILVSPHRTQRPWQGQVEKTAQEHQPNYDPTCYLCPGNARAGGNQTPKYESVYIFDNDYPALLPDTPEATFEEDGLLVARSERGLAKVICFSPRHDLTLARMEPADIRKVVDAWAEQYQELGSLPYIGHVQIFENRGAMMGASNPHPHGQIWAEELVPNEPSKEQAAQARYQTEHGSCLLCDYTKLEIKDGSRIVVENDEWLAVVPFWAVWPFETLVVSKRHAGAISDLDDAQKDGLAALLKQLTTRYDNLFEVSFPYSMGFHQAPTDGKEYPHHHLHAHFFPPLLRSATIRKFMVGYELLGNAQRDITAESSAERLRSLADEHYTLREQ